MNAEGIEALTHIEHIQEEITALKDANKKADANKWYIVGLAISGMFAVFVLVIQLMWPVVNVAERFVSAYEKQTTIFNQISIDTKNNAKNNAAIFKYIMARDNK